MTSDISDPFSGGTRINARNWLLEHSRQHAEGHDGGYFPTPEGKLSIIDPLCTTVAEFIEVPKENGRLFLLSDADGYWTQFALLFGDGDVFGGAYHFDCIVDGGVASPITPSSLDALNDLRAQIPQSYPPGSPNHRFPAPNLYIEHFEQFDEEGADPLRATLPDGTLMPFIRSGYGDGVYPVYSLTDQQGSLLAVYCDFVGDEETENWIMPPGVRLN